jgi:membrane glycosyltransferase
LSNSANPGFGVYKHVLSDTTDPDIWIEEELTWALLRTTCQGDGGIFYRRRAQNIQRKSGNIQDFCTRWGSHYRYMVVLDADSLVEARTLLEMVWRMEQDERIGILQSPPMPINQRSPFARLQQFAGHFYGSVFTAGYSLWSQWHGNYWGHNAIIRVQAFIDCCALPELPGESPLGGEILSHDFVEAALLHRRGWKVVVDNDIEGSYEEIPATLVEFAERDQRWCQGNLQHVRLVFSHGLQMLSRVQLGMGAMSYLASALWAIFLVLVVLFGIGTTLPVDTSSKSAIALELFIGTIALLLLPKLWALILARLRQQDIAGFAGLRKAAISTLLEVIASVLMAPILMVFHTMFVIKALGGQAVKWETGQHGGKRFTYSQLFSVCSVHTFVGLAGSLLVTWFVPGMLVWLAPILAPLVFSMPIAMLLGSERIGNWLIDKRLLVIPYESHPTRIIRRQQSLLREREIATCGDGLHPFDRLIVSPALNHLHIVLLGNETSCDSPERMDRLKRIALAGGGAHLSKSERMEILFDAEALQWLHKNAWTDWPLDLIEQCGVCLHKTDEAPSRKGARSTACRLLSG